MEQRRRKAADRGTYRGRVQTKPTQSELDRRAAASALYKTPHFGTRRSYALCLVSYACGLVKRCVRLADQEGPAEIQDVLLGAFEGEEKPTHVFSDKACLMLKHLPTEKTAGGRTLWEEHWRETTRFLLDPFHARAHPEDDVVCRLHAKPAEVLKRDDPDGVWNTSVRRTLSGSGRS